MATEQSGDPGRTPGSAEGDRETVEQDLQEKQDSNKNVNPPTSGQDVNQHSSGKNRKETGEVSDEHDN